MHHKPKLERYTIIKENTVRSMVILSIHNAELCLSGYCFHDMNLNLHCVFELNNWQPRRDLSSIWNLKKKKKKEKKGHGLKILLKYCLKITSWNLCLVL